MLVPLILIGCAGQIPPSGGPVDKNPPQIVYSSPHQKQLNFDSYELTVRFDKYMNHRSVESATYFPPFGGRELSFDWSGKDFIIRVNKKMRADQTYILTIGAPALDQRNNTLGRAFNLVFSTGAHVDTGTVSGKVYSDKAQPYTVSAFPVTSKIDTLRPFLSVAQYVTQSDDSGSYFLQGLADGEYRLICFNDDMRNFTYAPQADMYSSATQDISISAAKREIDGVNFITTTEDTTPPQLYSADLTKNGSLLLKFSEPIDSGSIKPDYFVLSDSITTKRVPIAFATRMESEKQEVVLVPVRKLPNGRTFLISAVDSVKDLQLNPVSLRNDTVSFTTDSATVDVPGYLFNFKDSTFSVLTYDTLFCQILPTGADIDSFSVKVTLNDSLGKSHPEFVHHVAPSIYTVTTSDLNSLEWYSLKLAYKYSTAGITKDSSVIKHFRTVDFATLGELDGKVTDAPRGRNIVVVAIERSGKRFYTLAKPDGSFVLNRLPAAEYSVRAYVQHPPEMIHYSGKSFPYQFADPFAVYPETVKVRARWATEGVAVFFF